MKFERQKTMKTLSAQFDGVKYGALIGFVSLTQDTPLATALTTYLCLNILSKFAPDTKTIGLIVGVLTAASTVNGNNMVRILNNVIQNENNTETPDKTEGIMVFHDAPNLSTPQEQTFTFS